MDDSDDPSSPSPDDPAALVDVVEMELDTTFKMPPTPTTNAIDTIPMMTEVDENRRLCLLFCRDVVDVVEDVTTTTCTILLFVEKAYCLDIVLFGFEVLFLTMNEIR